MVQTHRSDATEEGQRGADRRAVPGSAWPSLGAGPSGPSSAGLHALGDTIRSANLDSAVAQIAGLRRWIDVVEVEVVAQHQAAGVDNRHIEQQLQRVGRATRRDSRRLTRRGEAVQANPALIDLLVSGELGTAHLDAIASAVAELGPEAASAPDLLASLANVSADQARGTARDWVHAQKSPDDIEDAERKRRRRRDMRTFTDADDDVSVLQLRGDRASIGEMKQAIQAAAKRLYERDGGRDRPASEHPRTYDQRLFDAAHGLITGADADTGSGLVRSPGTARPTVVFVHHPKGTGGSDSPGRSELVGEGPVSADRVASVLADGANLVGMICDDDGEVLWQGRAKRHATNQQFLALVVRDGGCVLCRASHLHCEAHHLTPWNAPAKGRTNIDEMALLCSGCHHQLHDGEQTLFRDRRTGVWRTRPATPAETPNRSPHRGSTRRGATTRADPGCRADTRAGL